MHKHAFKTLILFFCLFFTTAFADETLTITTYYPSPYGSYNELQLAAHATPIATCNAATKGTMYLDSDDFQVKICDGAGNWVSKTPQVIHTLDSGGGCPGVRAANTDLILQTIVLPIAANVSISGQIIRNATGRVDLLLYIDNVVQDRTLTYTSSAQWEDAHVHWVGNLAAGSHDISLRSPTADVWGCGGSWGSLDTVIYY